ncbi:hypothetical protein HZ326_24885 [Fusarium oxysporum f. sp. albedinis]|nr:hypothetical protein HZ326_24885 [Fusarium oxysporum f. sp. albedinis]
MPYTNVDLQNLTSKDVEYFYYHLFLPDKLPDRDNNCSKDERLLMSFVHRSLESFITKTNPEAGAAIKAYSFMIGRLQKSKNAHGFLSVGGVQNVLQQLSLKGAALKHDLTQILTHRAIAPSALFHMPAQNSGAFMYRTAASVTFETFELSPSNKDVMETRRRLVPNCLMDTTSNGRAS